VLDGSARLQSGTGPVAILLGVFGAIGGMFVADWWADRNCEESCGQADIPTLFLGGALGGMIGYLVGGGEIPEPEPPPRR
jgi:ABC-type xylose transport system permease subunit